MLFLYKLEGIVNIIDEIFASTKINFNSLDLMHRILRVCLLKTL